MPIRAFVPAAALLVAGLVWAGLTAPARSVPPANTIRVHASTPGGFELQGAGSCAAAACHNADPLTGGRREYAVAWEREPTPPWHVKDLHGQAYDILFTDRSKQIERNLKGLADIEKAHPERNDLCLRCHVHPGYARDDFTGLPVNRHPIKIVDGVRQLRLEDGVSCEACHGPAQHWLAEHFRGDWRSLDTTARRSRGMADTRSLPGRIAICVDCHVGAPGMDVNHDLIAAGHPRLNFEFSDFHFKLHKHWDYAKDKDPARDPRGRKDFEAYAWALGQIASAHAALRLLAHRADDMRNPWPELAEYNCYACHHDLVAQPWPQANREPGRVGKLTWNPWYYAMLPEAVAALGGAWDAGLEAQLCREVETPHPDRQKTARLARQAADLLAPLLRSEPTAALPASSLFDKILGTADARSVRTWDHASQLHATLAALERGRRDLGAPAFSLRGLHSLLRFPLGYDSPGDYDPAKAAKVIEQLRHRKNN